jgi:hypothetical protein
VIRDKRERLIEGKQRERERLVEGKQRERERFVEGKQREREREVISYLCLRPFTPVTCSGTINFWDSWKSPLLKPPTKSLCTMVMLSLIPAMRLNAMAKAVCSS